MLFKKNMNMRMKFFRNSKNEQADADAGMKPGIPAAQGLYLT